MATPDLLQPPPLLPGATIALVAPSRPASPRRAAASRAYLEGRGYQVRIGRHLESTHHYLAGRDMDRAADLREAFLDPAVGALFCVRGGYGSGRVLDLIDPALVRAHPKIVLGFSDTTALHLGLFARTGLVGFTGALTDIDLSGRSPDQCLENSLWRALTSTSPLGCLTPEHHELDVLRPGRASGRLIPANLSLLCSLLGTSYFPDLSGALLLVEDVREYPYRLDRMLNQLRLAGVLKGLGALILGQFRDCQDPDEPEISPTLEEMVLELTQGVAIPILAGFPYGHFPRRLVLPIGVNAVVDTSQQLVELTEPALVA